MVAIEVRHYRSQDAEREAAVPTTVPAGIMHEVRSTPHEQTRGSLSAADFVVYTIDQHRGRNVRRTVIEAT